MVKLTYFPENELFDIYLQHSHSYKTRKGSFSEATLPKFNWKKISIILNEAYETRVQIIQYFAGLKFSLKLGEKCQ
jgi:hypothetical protein